MRRLITLFVVIFISYAYLKPEQKRQAVRKQVPSLSENDAQPKAPKSLTQSTTLSKREPQITKEPYPPNIKLKAKEVNFTPFFQNKLNEVQNDLNLNRAALEFEAIDTTKNFEISKNILINPYSSVPTTNEAKNRVLALTFLMRSSQLSRDSCVDIVKSLIKQYSEGTNTQKWAILWDAPMIAEACASSARLDILELSRKTPKKLALQLEVIR